MIPLLDQAERVSLEEFPVVGMRICRNTMLPTTDQCCLMISLLTDVVLEGSFVLQMRIFFPELPINVL